MSKDVDNISEKLLHKGLFTEYLQTTISFSDGYKRTYDVVKHNGASVMLAVGKNDEIYFVKQYRAPLQMELLELPAGKLEKQEDPLDCAKRELQEEIGFRAQNFSLLCEFYTAPGFTNEKLYLYLAKDLVPSKLDSEDGERIEVVTYKLNEAKKMIHQGLIKDAKTIIGLLLYEKIL